MPELRLEDQQTVGALGGVLREQGYNGATLREATGARGEFVTPTPSDLPIVLRQLKATRRLEQLMRLFLFNLPMERDQAAAALEPVAIERLVGVGLLAENADGRVDATVRIVPHEELVFVCDRFEQELVADDPEYVAPPNPSSLSLDMLTIRRPVASALDIGTGFGIQALRTASHSDRVVACDLNPRAVNYTAFNAQLNGFGNVEARAGNLFEPVAGEQFELIICNPPYIISPDTEFLYRDSGMPADSLCEQVLREAPAHLVEGGIAQILISWIIRDADEEWWARPEGWVMGSGCDACFLHFKTDLPVDTAAVQRSVLFSHDPEYIAETLDRWLEYYRTIGAVAIGYGAVVLRKRSAATNWLRFEALSMSRAGVAGEHLVRLIAAADHLSSLPAPEALLDERLVLADSHVLEERLSAREGSWGLVEAQLTLEQGLGFAGTVDAPTIRLLPLCDGQRTVREALGLLAEAVGMAEPPEDLERFVAAGLPMVRRLYELGFLVQA